MDSSRRGCDAVLVGVGTGIVLGDDLTATVDVQGEARERETAVSATAGLRWKL